MAEHAPSSEIADLDAAKTAFGRGLSEDAQLSILHALDSVSRTALLGGLPSASRDQLLGSTAMDIETIRSHQTGVAYQYDFTSLPTDFSGHRGDVARAMAILAKRAYEPFPADGADPTAASSVRELVRQGFDVHFLGKDQGSTQAFVAVRGKQVVFSARGTEPDKVNDLLIDADVKKVERFGGKVHAGFDEALSQVWPDVERILRAASAKLPAGEKLAFYSTGHSLGAAIAAFVAIQTKETMSDAVEVVGVYPWAMPRGFDGDAALQYDRLLGDRTFRYVNNTDLVTQVPPAAMGYAHIGLPLYFDHAGTLRPGMDRRSIAKDRAAAYLSDGYLAKMRARGGEIESLWDHGASGYVKHLFANEDVVVDTTHVRRKLIDDALTSRNVSRRRARRALGWLAGMDVVDRASTLFRMSGTAMGRLRSHLDRDADTDRRQLLFDWLTGGPAGVRHAAAVAALAS